MLLPCALLAALLAAGHAGECGVRWASGHDGFRCCAVPHGHGAGSSRMGGGGPGCGDARGRSVGLLFYVLRDSEVSVAGGLSDPPLSQRSELVRRSPQAVRFHTCVTDVAGRCPKSRASGTRSAARPAVLIQ